MKPLATRKPEHKSRLPVWHLAIVPAIVFLAAFAASLSPSIAQEAPEPATAAPDSPEPICPAHLAKEEDNLPYKYWGNSFSGKFHRPSCPFAQAMDPKHIIFFHFRHKAIEAGQVPCRYCLPPYWKVVKAQILTPKAN